MQHRHFLVSPENDDYKLRELLPEIAESIRKFGTPAGQYYTVESIHWTFYFMNCKISRRHAEKISAELTQNFLDGKSISQINHSD
ncbi:MAG: hypothetical protein Phog2KO_30710 [Phototrophicaceae bacterium]